MVRSIPVREKGTLGRGFQILALAGLLVDGQPRSQAPLNEEKGLSDPSLLGGLEVQGQEPQSDFVQGVFHVLSEQDS